MFNRNLNLNEIDNTNRELFSQLFPSLLDTPGCVIIFGHYRSGTTALTSFIELIKQVENFGELLEEDHPYGDRDQIKAMELLKNNNFFVFNVKPRYYYRLPNCFLNNSIPNYKIKLNRENIIDQLTSLCVQVMDDRVGFDPRYPKPDYSLHINLDTIRRCIYSYLDFQDVHNNTTIKFDAEVTYDEIKPLLQYSNIKTAWRPQNYNEIYETVNNEYILAINRISRLNKWINQLGC